METTPPTYGQMPAQPPKKGLGTGAKIGIGCGVIVLLIVLGIGIATVVFGPKLKKIGEEFQKNPTRAQAELTVSLSGGNLEMVAQDDENKRYTLKDKTGGLTTIYWDEKAKVPKTIPGDFSAIPADAATPIPETELVPVPDPK